MPEFADKIKNIPNVKLLQQNIYTKVIQLISSVNLPVDSVTVAAI